MKLSHPSGRVDIVDEDNSTVSTLSKYQQILSWVIVSAKCPPGARQDLWWTPDTLQEPIVTPDGNYYRDTRNYFRSATKILTIL